MPEAFTSYPWLEGYIAELDRAYPSHLSAWNGDDQVDFDGTGTHFGYCDKGPTEFYVPAFGIAYWLHSGMYFSCPLPFHIRKGRGVVITREGWHGFFQLGGPIEHKGRLRYIDGCTDSLIVSPPKKGDPCLNLLYFPPGVDQTAHVHPSDRIGIILSGKGRCVYDADNKIVDLVPGMMFCIHTNGLHKFQTPYGEDMRVMAYHPETDFGPDDEAHPMLNRTIIEGVSAADPARAQYRTGKEVEV
jgi:mannose-6-phosphate isomerase-like protein (cupin superfamily)